MFKYTHIYVHIYIYKHLRIPSQSDSSPYWSVNIHINEYVCLNILTYMFINMYICKHLWGIPSQSDPIASAGLYICILMNIYV
jgi:hypothetical protein